MNKKIESFWNIETIRVNENKLVYKTFRKEITDDTNEKRYRAKLQFKHFQETGPDNFKNSEKLF